jgi:ABC-type nitrate/sulfonate/bicarbonate transport system substrate-binding protein
VAAVKLVVPDLISNSYFPVIAAADLGFFERHGLDLTVELLFPVSDAYRALRDGAVDFVGGSAHSALAAFPRFAGVKLLAAQAQGMYWFLVMRGDIGAKRGALECVKGRTIGAAPWVEMGLRALLEEAGFDLERDGIRIVPVPGSQGAGVNFGVTAARALEERRIDGFWANGMGTEVAVRRSAGTVVLDVRRGDGPPGCFDYTFSALATSERLLQENRGAATAAVRALLATLRALKADPELATGVGRKRFPPAEAELIAELVRRDLPYYDATITRAAVSGMSRFARALGILDLDLAYEDAVASEFAPLWSAPPGKL